MMMFMIMIMTMIIIIIISSIIAYFFISFFSVWSLDTSSMVIYLLFYCKPKLASNKLPCNSGIRNCILDWI